MRLTNALLVIVDISGYTSFITKRSVSLLHAEQIITELMETVIDLAEHPLTVNKLEGDAALLYRECDNDDTAAARDVFAQVKAFFPAFYHCLARQRELRSHCGCGACSNIDQLALKAFIHAGEIAIKQVRNFEELAGEEVILIHRLLKNHVPLRDYVLMTEAARAIAQLQTDGLQSHHKELEGVGETALWLADSTQIPFELLMPSGKPSAAPLLAEIERNPVFRHLPAETPGLWQTLKLKLGIGSKSA